MHGIHHLPTKTTNLICVSFRFAAISQQPGLGETNVDVKA